MMAYELRNWTTFYFLCLTFIFKALVDSEEVNIGGVFSHTFSQEQGALKHAIFQHNIRSNYTTPQLLIGADVKNPELSDIFSLGTSLCDLFNFEGGIYMVVGVSSSTSLPTIKSYSNKFHIPYITPSLSGTGLLSDETDFQLYLRPSPIPVLVELIFRHRWDTFHYLYDDLEGLYRLEQLLEVAANRNFNIKPLHLRGVADVRPFLRKVMASQKLKIVIDTTSITRTETVLTQALQLGMVTEDYHFIVLDFDIKNINIENFKYGGVNITGLAMMNETNPQYEGFKHTWSKITRKYPGQIKNTGFFAFQSALIYDSLAVITEAFKLMHEDKTEISSKASQCDIQRFKQWSDGQTFLNYLKKVDANGLTGRLQFDDLGRRKNYYIDLLSLIPDPVSGQTKFDKIGTWNSSAPKQFSIGRDGTIVEPEGDILNKTLIITTIEAEPYYMLKKNADEFTDEQDKYEGYCVDLLKAISSELKFKYKFKLVSDGKYGGYDIKTGQWDGMVRELIDGEADVAVAPLTITSQREQFVEFTTPFMNLGISIMIKKPQNTKPGVFSFLHPLSHEIWMCIVFAYVGVSVVLFLVSRFSPYEWHTVDAPPPLFGDSGDRQEMANDFGIFNSLWFSLGAFMQQGCDISPRSLSGRIVGGVWWFFTLIIISSYTANLAAFLTVERMISPIESADDLSKQTEIAYGTVYSGSTKGFFETTKVDVYKKMWAYMSEAEDVFVDTIQDGISKVRSSKGRYAFLLESTMNDYVNQRKPCDTIKVGDNLNSRGYGIAMRKGYPLKENFTLAILRLREDSVLHKLEQTWWFEKGECGPPDAKSQETASELRLSNVAGVFYILVGGLGLAMLVALMEFCYKSRKEARKAKTSLSIAMRAKARMSVKGDNVNVSTPEFTKSLSTVPISRTNNLRTSQKGGSGNPFARKSLTHSPSEEDLLAKGKMEEIYLKERTAPQNYFDHARIKDSPY